MATLPLATRTIAHPKPSFPTSSPLSSIIERTTRVAFLSIVPRASVNQWECIYSLNSLLDEDNCFLTKSCLWGRSSYPVLFLFLKPSSGASVSIASVSIVSSQRKGQATSQGTITNRVAGNLQSG